MRNVGPRVSKTARLLLCGCVAALGLAMVASAQQPTASQQAPLPEAGDTDRPPTFRAVQAWRGPDTRPQHHDANRGH